jgi:hypothetical protein
MPLEDLESVLLESLGIPVNKAPMEVQPVDGKLVAQPVGMPDKGNPELEAARSQFTLQEYQKAYEKKHGILAEPTGVAFVEGPTAVASAIGEAEADGGQVVDDQQTVIENYPFHAEKRV